MGNSTTLSVKIVKTEKIMTEAAGYLWEELRKRLGKGKKILLLLSGGSGVEMYPYLKEWMEKQKEGLAKNLTVGLIDERYGTVGHADSNEKQIRDTGFYEVVEEKGGKVLSVLTGKDSEQEARRYESAVRQSIDKVDEAWAVMGMGPDGHTAGILPPKSLEEFEKTFPSNRWVVYYELPPDYPNPFKKRITLTPAALKEINFAVTIVKSKGKEEALRKMFAPGEPIHKTPAVLLRDLPGVLFTDFT